MDISVVVPVYNTSRFLRQCVDSLINQTWKDVEFILVDDGSTDDSLEILKEYQKRDARIKVLEQKNLHAGVARNNGMKQATGKYIIFLDSDDFFSLDMLESALCCAKKNQAEIVIFGFNNYDALTGEKKPAEIKLPSRVFSANEPINDLIKTCQAVAWNKLYLRSFIERNNLKFEARKKCNDSYFTQMSLVLAERMVFLNRRLVNYRINNPSSLQGNMSLSRESFIDCSISVKKDAMERNIYQGYVKAALVRYAIQIAKRGASAPISSAEYEAYYQYIKKHLIPDLFNCEQDFMHDSYMSNLYHSRDLGEFLLLQLHDTEETLKTGYISKDSYDYRIGHALMGLPRRIMRLFDETERRKPK